jgi:hypothetical protein
MIFSLGSNVLHPAGRVLMFALAGLPLGREIACAVELITGFFPFVAVGTADGAVGQLYVTADAIPMHGPFQTGFVKMIVVSVTVLFP